MYRIFKKLVEMYILSIKQKYLKLNVQTGSMIYAVLRSYDKIRIKSKKLLW